MKRVRFLGSVAGAALGLLFSSPSVARESGAIHTSARFVFVSDFETNLHDALIAAGVARRFDRPELFRAGAELACFDALPAVVRAGWSGAAAFYADNVSPTEWNSPAQYSMRLDLTGLEGNSGDAASRDLLAIARGFRQAAAPAYRACRWPVQDERNRRWVEALQPLLAAHESVIARRLEEVYRKQWNGLPIQVDLVGTVNWAGANSAFPDGVGGHLLISSENPPGKALELVFHEASHGLMLREDPLRLVLAAASTAAVDRDAPSDLWHALLFFTTGEVVRQVLAGAGKTDYTPIVEELFARGTWTDLRGPLESAWGPYLRGEQDAATAAARLLDSLPSRPRKSDG